MQDRGVGHGKLYIANILYHVYVNRKKSTECLRMLPKLSDLFLTTDLVLPKGYMYIYTTEKENNY